MLTHVYVYISYSAFFIQIESKTHRVHYILSKHLPKQTGEVAQPFPQRSWNKLTKLFVTASFVSMTQSQGCLTSLCHSGKEAKTRFGYFALFCFPQGLGYNHTSVKLQFLSHCHTSALSTPPLSHQHVLMSMINSDCVPYSMKACLTAMFPATGTCLGQKVSTSERWAAMSMIRTERRMRFPVNHSSAKYTHTHSLVLTNWGKLLHDFKLHISSADDTQ